MSVERIKAALGEEGWLHDEADTLRYRRDWRGARTGEALGVARPASAGEAAQIVRLAVDAGIALVPQGGNTGLVEGSVPTEARPTIIVTTERMRAVRSLDPANFTLIAEAGCVVQSLQEETARADRLFPLSLASEGSATLGGTLSTNAGGNQTIRFGNAREQVLGLEAVLPDGTLFEGLSTLRKNNTGYDLKHLFIGAEGTLGIITAAAIRLFPLPRQRETAMLAVPSPHAALDLLGRAREISGDSVLAFELMPRYSLDLALEHVEGVVDPLASRSPWYVLLELATPSDVDDLRAKLEVLVAQAMERGLVSDGVVAESVAQRAALWRPREEQAEAGRRAGGGRVSGDVSVPVSRVARFLEVSRARFEALIPGVGLNTFGHAGDGNIHYSLRQPGTMGDAQWAARAPELARILNGIVVDFEGSFSAEHGIGAQKRETLRELVAPSRLGLMRAVKDAIDPRGLMNPGKIL